MLIIWRGRWKRPALIDVVSAKHEIALPPKIQWAHGGKGFSLYMLRAVLNGRTDEVVGLANTHFRRARRVRSAESL